MTIKRLSLTLAFLTLFFSQTLYSQTLRALTYNVWGLPGVLVSTPERFELIYHFIGAYRADIISFNETFHEKTEILSQIEGYPYHTYGLPKKGMRTSSGLLILSKYPIIMSKRLLFSKCSGSDCFSRKGALLARVLVPGIGEVDVITTHLNAGPVGKSKVRLRKSQLEQIKDFVEEHSEGRPLIMMGDFNFVNNSPHPRWIRDNMYFDDTLELHRQNNPGLPDDEYNGYTYKFGNMFFRYDYIWLRNDGPTALNLNHHQVIFDGKFGGPKLSDHYGVLAEFTF